MPWHQHNILNSPFSWTIFSQIGPSLKSLHSGAKTDASDGKSMAQAFTKIGFYKGTKVAIRKVDRGPIILSRDNLLELKAASSLM